MCLGRDRDTPFNCQQYNMPHNSQDEYYTVYDYMDEGMYTVYYRNYSVGCADSEIVVQVAGVLWYEQEPPEETPTPTPVATWIVPPSPTPRVREASKRPSGQATLTLSCNRERSSSVGSARRCLVSCSRLLPGLQACFNGCGRWRRGCFRARGEAGGGVIGN